MNPIVPAAVGRSVTAGTYVRKRLKPDLLVSVAVITITVRVDPRRGGTDRIEPPRSLNGIAVSIRRRA